MSKGKKIENFPFRNEKERANAEQREAMEVAKKTMQTIPTIGILNSMKLMIEVLSERGEFIRDFDRKDKVVREVIKIGPRIYFLTEKETRKEIIIHGQQR